MHSNLKEFVFVDKEIHLLFPPQANHLLPNAKLSSIVGPTGLGMRSCFPVETSSSALPTPLQEP